MDAAHTRVARNVRRIARTKRLAITHVADRAGVSRAELFNVLGGEKSPTVRLLVKLADALEVDIAELFAPLVARPSPKPPAR